MYWELIWERIMDHDHQVVVSAESGGAGTSLKERVRSLRLPQQTLQRQRGIKGTVVLLSLVCLGLAGLASFLGYEYYVASDRLADLDKSRTKLADGVVGKIGDSRTASDSVEGGSAIASSGEVVLERKGYIIPAHQIMISPKVSGMIESLNIEEGKRVKKGEILAQIETVDYQADYDHSRASFEGVWQRGSNYIRAVGPRRSSRRRPSSMKWTRRGNSSISITNGTRALPATMPSRPGISNNRSAPTGLWSGIACRCTRL